MPTAKSDEERKKHAAYMRDYYRRFPEKYVAKRQGERVRKTGCTQEEYDRLMLVQDGKCAICRKPAEENRDGVLHRDHCHATRKVRGLLCNECNTALGLLRDNPVTALAAASYLIAWI